MSNTERCPICNEPMEDEQDTDFWGEVEEVHAECNPEKQAYEVSGS